MSAPEVRIGQSTEEMASSQADVAIGGGDGAMDTEVNSALEMLGGQDDSIAASSTSRPRFVERVPHPHPTLDPTDSGNSYLRSPMIEVAIGTGEEMQVLMAHEALLVQSPFFAAAIAKFSPDATARRVEFPDEHLDAMGAVLEFLYTGEYTPRKMGDRLEGSKPEDALDEGDELLRHARVYTLAEKLGTGDLKALAHSKVHRVNSSARGEIAYARYVYANTPKDDTAIRRPIASFWGQRSHVLRHDAEDDFRTLCIEFPEFGFDVLSYVLDARERKGKDRDRDRESVLAESETPNKSGRKRARHL